MRAFLAKTLCIAGPAMLAMTPAEPALAKTFVYVSNAEDGDISVFELAPNTGVLTPGERVSAGKTVGPLTTSPSRRHLLAAVRSKPYTVVVYEIDRATGKLNPVSRSPLPASMPYISMDKTGAYLFSSSYDGDVVAVHRFDRHGKVSEQALQVMNTAQNAHSVRIDNSNKFLFVPNLGGEQVMQLKFNAATGTLETNDPPAVKTKMPTGPRHFDISSDNKFVYVLGELNAAIITYRLDQQSGQLTEVANTPGLPPGSTLRPGAPRGPMRDDPPGMAPHADTSHDIWAADIHLTADNRYLYTSERTKSQINAFKVDHREGRLTYVGSYDTETQPRGFAITPDNKYLIASGEKSQTITVYRIDTHTGALEAKGKYPVGKGANWVEIVKF